MLLEVAPKAPAKRKGKDVSREDDGMTKTKARRKAKATTQSKPGAAAPTTLDAED